MNPTVIALLLWAFICGPLAGIGALYLFQLSGSIGLIAPTEETTYTYKDVPDATYIKPGGVKKKK